MTEEPVALRPLVYYRRHTRWQRLLERVHILKPRFLPAPQYTYTQIVHTHGGSESFIVTDVSSSSITVERRDRS